MKKHQISLLHVSDLHIRSDESGPQGWRRRRVLGTEWEKNLSEIIASGPLDLVCFTGDLAQSGKSEEYSLLTDFVEGLLDLTKVPRSRLFVVPGNHDIDRDNAPDVWKTLRSIETHEEQVLSRWMAGGKGPRGVPDAYRDEILDRQRAYRDWVSTALKRPDLLPDAANGHARLGYCIEVSGWPFPVHVVGFDSAWLAGDNNEQGKLRLTDEQVGRLTDGLTGFRLAMIHHPLTDLADGAECRRLLADRVDLLLRGHLHETELSLWTDPDRDLRELAAGCLYQHDRYPNACQRIDVTLDDRGTPLSYDVRFRAWSPRGFWHDDNSIYRGVTNGRYTWVRHDAPSAAAAPAALAVPAGPVGPAAGAHAVSAADKLSHAELIELCEAAIRTGLSTSTLRSGIDRLVVASFETAPALGAQLLLDLTSLNDLALGGDKTPLETWLLNAVALSGPRKERAVFEKALAKSTGSASPGSP